MLLTNIQIECIFSSSAASKARGRSQSMRTAVRTTEFNSNPQSASSSTGSLVDTIRRPVASTSKAMPSSSSATSTADKRIKLIPCELNCFEEANNTEQNFSAPNLTTTTPYALKITKQQARNYDEIIDPL